jgi:uncharacterized membrane protein YeaQ/YmgE (transglycosylase-associated protein family)
MAIVNCLWIGALAGLVAARIRFRGGLPTVASCVAVGVLGALVGGVMRGWIGSGAELLPGGELPFAAGGAVAALSCWLLARRALAPTSLSTQLTDASRRRD